VVPQIRLIRRPCCDSLNVVFIGRHLACEVPAGGLFLRRNRTAVGSEPLDGFTID